MSKERHCHEILFHTYLLDGLSSHRADMEIGHSRPDRHPHDQLFPLQSLQAGFVVSGQGGQACMSHTQIQLLSEQVLHVEPVHPVMVQFHHTHAGATSPVGPDVLPLHGHISKSQIELINHLESITNR